MRAWNLPLQRMVRRMEPLFTADKVKSFLAQATPDNIAALSASLREQNGRFGATLVQALPDLLNAHAALLSALLHAVNELPPDERRAQIAAAAGRVDGAALGRALTELADAVHETHRRDPELIARLAPVLAEATRAADFGRLREGAVAWSSYRADALHALLAPALADPVRLANFFSALPDLLNRHLRLAADLLGAINLPPEIVASGVLNALESVDREQLARALNTAATLFNQLREGDWTLGGNEPRFAAVLGNVAADLLRQLDTPALTRALVAAGEDLGVIIKVVVELILRDPALTERLTLTGVAWNNVLLRALADTLHAVAQLPDEQYRQLFVAIMEHWRQDEMMQSFNEAVGLYLRFARLTPDLQREYLRRLLDGIDGEQLRDAWTLTGRAIGDVLRERELATPERLGRGINNALVRFNRRMDALDGGPGEFFKRVLGQIDAAELRRTANHIFGGLTHALLAGAERAQAVLQPLMKNGRRLTGFIVRQWLTKWRRPAPPKE